MLARRDQSNQIEHSINQIQSNPVELNHMIGFGNRIQSSSHKKNGAIKCRLGSIVFDKVDSVRRQGNHNT